MLEDKGVLFLIADEEEILSMRTSDDIFNLYSRYEIAADIHFYSAFLALFKLLFPKGEITLLEEVESNLDDRSEIFLLSNDFVTKLAAFNDEKTNSLAKKWTESYWETSSLGIWSQLYCLRFACKTAIENEKNVYALNG